MSPVYFLSVLSAAARFKKKIADLFGLLTRSTRTKNIIFALTDIASAISTIGVSMLVAFIYQKSGNNHPYIEGIIYGLGAIGVHQAIIEGKLLRFIKAWRKK